MNRSWVASAAGLGLCVLALSSSAIPAALAQGGEERSCLQNNRIWGWNVVNERTIVVTDHYDRPFLVRLTSGCVGLTNATFALRFKTWTELGCLEKGDTISYRDRTLGFMTCTVTEVQPYVPGPNDRYYSGRGPYSGRDD
jgi:hypothetical protein